MTARPLGELAGALTGGRLQGDASLAVNRIETDSRRVGPGALFVAVRGSAADGHLFVSRALASGAVAVVVDDAYEGELPAGAAVVRCASTRPAPALLARALHGAPDRDLLTVGVTGTNGKTTTAFLLQEMLERLHGPCGLLGTIRYDDGKTRVPAPLTTPAGPVFFENLRRMVDNGCRSVAMELSSHALDQQRTAGVGLDAAVMTNLGRDHLDYHESPADYLAAKARIMELLRPADGTNGGGALVLNAGDPHLASLPTADRRVIRFCTGRTAGPTVDLQVTAADLSRQGTHLRLTWLGQEIGLDSPLVGRFNVENLTAALGAGLALGLEPAACAAALSGVTQVPGRLERFALPTGAIAVVDYAHTHDALAAVLGACDELGAESLLLVFGCGGDRDRGKRALMATVAATASDRVWITSDNPRSEDPAAICAEIAAAYDAAQQPRARSREVIVDRADAIRAAMAAAGPRDVVIVAGKGHEDYQLVGDQVLPLDDRRLVADWIAAQSENGTVEP